MTPVSASLSWWSWRGPRAGHARLLGVRHLEYLIERGIAQAER